MQPGIGPGGLQAALLADCRIRASRASRRRPAAATPRSGSAQDLGAAFASVADELHSQYLLGFAPPKRDGKVHDIDVRVASRG